MLTEFFLTEEALGFEVYRDYKGLYRGYIGIMEKKMETTYSILGLRFNVGVYGLGV